METWFQELIGTYGYLACFVTLLLCGVGLPLPEEITLIGAGMLLAAGELHFAPAVVVCSVAILLGDALPFFLGRRYGLRALRIRWVARILHPERFARLQARFKEHGNWATFTLRFFAGVRIPGYFVAGTMRMSWGRFLLLDGLGVMISVPVSILIGRAFHASIQDLQARIRDLHLILGFLAIALLGVLALRWRRRRPERPARGAEAP